MDRKTALIARIREVFAKREYPGDQQLVVDDSGTDLEQIEVAEAFKGKRWDELSIQTLETYHAALSFFTPEAFHYYLPAYLVGYVAEEAALVDGREWLIYSLMPPSVSFRVSILNISDETLALLPPEARDLLLKAQEQFKAITEAGGGAEVVEQRQQSWFENKMAGFTAEEKTLIRDFLQYAQDNDDDNAQKALDGWWKDAVG